METPFIGGQRDRSGSAGPSRRKCLICGSRALRALWVAFCCNTVFTVSQAFGSIISNSKALGADTGTMFVDSGTYLINIGAEYYRSKSESSERTAAAIDIAASAVSVVALALVTAFFLHDSITALQEEPSEGGSGDAGSGGADDSVTDTRLASTISSGQAKVHTVEHLMSACAGLGIDNLIIDITMIGSILLRNRGGWWGLLTCKWHVRAAEVTSFQSVVPAGAPPTRVGQTGPTNAPQDGTVNVAHNGAADEEKITKTGDLNVVSALAHVWTS